MIPILYESSETLFNNNGIGRLSDITKCVVTEERNGVYECEFQYPVDGVLYSEIQFGRFIYCSAAQGVKQAFEIYASSKPINGHVTFNARHISYRASMIPVKPFTEDNVSDALSGLVTNSMETNPFTVWTNKNTVATYTQKEPASFRSRLGGVEGSILDVYGGEYEFDMYEIKLWSDRGQDRGVKIRYGKNLTDLKQEESIENTITGVVPFYKNQDIVIYGDVQSSAYASNYPYPRTICVDVSSDFSSDTTPTKAQVNAAGQSYLNSHSIGVPKVSLKVSFVNLAETEEYKNIAVLETVRLCDTVSVEFEKLGVSASAKVIKTVWDSLRDKYNSIELGEAKSSLSSQVANQQTEIAALPTTDVMQQAINRATDLITGESGGYVVIHQDELTGKPYEILIMDNEDINSAQKVWRWNQAGWGYSSTGYNGTYALAATIDGEIVADFIKAGTITGIAINNGNGTFTVDSAGNLIASSATIKTQDSLGRTEITDGSLTTYNRSSGNKGIKINGSQMNIYSWNNDGNFVGAVGSTYESGTGTQSAAMWCDAGDRVLIGYKVSGSDSIYKSLEINHDNAGGIMCRKSMGIDNVPLNVWNGSGNFVGCLRHASFNDASILLECDYGDRLRLGYRNASNISNASITIDGADDGLVTFNKRCKVNNTLWTNYPVVGANGTDNVPHAYGMMWVPGVPQLALYVDTVNVANISASISDKRKKKNINHISDDLIKAIGSVDLIQFQFIDEMLGDNTQVGVIAQDIRDACENNEIDWRSHSIVYTTKDGTLPDGSVDDKSDEYFHVNYEQFLITRLAYDEKKMSKMEEEIELLKEEIRLLKGEE